MHSIKRHVKKYKRDTKTKAKHDKYIYEMPEELKEKKRKKNVRRKSNDQVITNKLFLPNVKCNKDT